jgi:hypothetical protein
LRNVRLPNISVAPADPHYFFKPKLAAQFGRRTLEVWSSLSWLGNAIYPVRGWVLRVMTVRIGLKMFGCRTFFVTCRMLAFWVVVVLRAG